MIGSESMQLRNSLVNICAVTMPPNQIQYFSSSVVVAYKCDNHWKQYSFQHRQHNENVKVVCVSLSQNQPKLWLNPNQLFQYSHVHASLTHCLIYVHGFLLLESYIYIYTYRISMYFIDFSFAKNLSGSKCPKIKPVLQIHATYL